MMHWRPLQARLVEVYEGKVALLEEEVRAHQAQNLRAQRDGQRQRELNSNVQRAMTDMKNKYDTSAASWAAARKDLQERLEAVGGRGCGRAGTGGAGNGGAGQGRAGQGRAGQGGAGRGRAGRAGQGRAGQGRAGQGRWCEQGTLVCNDAALAGWKRAA